MIIMCQGSLDSVDKEQQYLQQYMIPTTSSRTNNIFSGQQQDETTSSEPIYINYQDLTSVIYNFDQGDNSNYNVNQLEPINYEEQQQQQMSVIQANQLVRPMDINMQMSQMNIQQNSHEDNFLVDNCNDDDQASDDKNQQNSTASQVGPSKNLNNDNNKTMIDDLKILNQTQKTLLKTLPYLKMIAGDPVRFVCEIHNRTFKHPKGILYHQYCGGTKKPLQCSHCDKTFTKGSHLEYHERKHTGEKPFQCHLCDKSFVQKNKLNRHLKLHTPEKKYMCLQCNKGFAEERNLREHEANHKTEPGTYACKTCDKRFHTQVQCNRHSKQTHGGDCKEHCCPHVKCGKSYRNLNVLRRHMRNHETGENKKKWVCDYDACKRAFHTKGELSRHNIKHQAEKPFQCTHPGCNIRFGRKDNMNRHIQTHVHSEDSASSSTSLLKEDASALPIVSQETLQNESTEEDLLQAEEAARIKSRTNEEGKFVSIIQFAESNKKPVNKPKKAKVTTKPSVAKSTAAAEQLTENLDNNSMDSEKPKEKSSSSSLISGASGDILDFSSIPTKNIPWYREPHSNLKYAGPLSAEQAHSINNYINNKREPLLPFPLLDAQVMQDHSALGVVDAKARDFPRLYDSMFDVFRELKEKTTYNEFVRWCESHLKLRVDEGETSNSTTTDYKTITHEEMKILYEKEFNR